MGSELIRRPPRLGRMSLLLVLFATVTPIDASARQSTAGLPPGFVSEALVAGLVAPTTMAWAPDDHLWIGGKNGNVWTLHLENLQAPELVVIGRIPVNTEGERGISGIAVDPDYSENRHIWIYYTTAGVPFKNRLSIRNRLSRFRHVGEQLVDETVILETPDLGNINHNGGCLRFAADKTLFVSTGDDDKGSETAQNTHDLRGKILHINRDGSPAADNPYLDGVEGDPRVWAYGFRNPWRCNLQPGSANLFIGDVGERTWDEVNLGFRGGNFGWRLTEGPDPPGVPGVRYPIYNYRHTSTGGNSIIGVTSTPFE
jgi:glucose/arabinose dehydrogenase